MRLKFITLIVLLAVISSCKKKEPVDNGDSYGILQISSTTVTQNILKQAANENITHVVVTIADDEGNNIYTLEKIPLYKFNSNYISEPISLIPGDYQVTEFFLLDETGAVIYVCPVELSDMAYLVNDPLPINFSITKDDVTNINVEVLWASDNTPEDFGYSTFGFSIVETFDFMLGVFIYNEASQNFELTSANITIESGAEELFINGLEAITNTIMLRDNYPDYTITVEKPGYESYQHTFPNDSLKCYSNDPIEIVLEKLPVPVDGLIAYYPFNGNANDESGNGNDGTVYGASLTTDRYDNANSAYSFNGIDNYIFVDPAFILSNGEGTFSAWAKFNDLTQIQYLGFIGDEHSSSYYISLLRFDPNHQTMSIYTHNPKSNGYLVGNTIINQDVYYHLVMTSDGSKWDIYINGVKETLTSLVGENTGAWAGDLFSVDDFMLGALRFQVPYDPAFFNGTLDDVRVYDRALSEEEILLLSLE